MRRRLTLIVVVLITSLMPASAETDTSYYDGEVETDPAISSLEAAYYADGSNDTLYDEYDAYTTQSTIDGVTTARDFYTTEMTGTEEEEDEFLILGSTLPPLTTEAPSPETTSMMYEEGMSYNEMHCQFSKFGCCSNGLNPAHGPDDYGCCAGSEYGCCPDNYYSASGPYDDGCESSNAKYGLCPDGITVALDPSLLGCGCIHMEHGCCPNGNTPAKGPEYEGCDCSTFEFGCCPDGVSIAQGKHFEGCKSCNSDLGCCPDGITPKGASESCDECQNTKYGCCFDGTTPASGLNFEGCESNPLEKLPATCSANSTTGPCTNFEIKWFYDAHWGGCNKFWYGGCDPGENHFDTEEECLGLCVNPRGSRVCHLNVNSGSCDAVYNEFYYDRSRGVCLPFVYGGCLGNGNRFTTRKACSDLCESDDMNVPVCSKPMAEGSCSGNFHRWYFNSEEGKCETFSYSGCGGNNNRFLSETECLNTCRKAINERRSVRVCRSGARMPPPQSTGGGPWMAVWKYDHLLRRCTPIYAHMEEINDFTFFTWEECSNICPSTYPPIISLPLGKEILVERQSSGGLLVPISIKANPPANVQWFKNGQFLDVLHDFRYELGHDSSLKLKGEAKDSDKGKYTIKADNGVGSPSTAEVIVVIYPLYSSVAIDLEKSIFTPDSNIVIPCVVNGYPPPTITWFKYEKGTPIPIVEDREKIFIDTFQTSTFISTSNLTISKSKPIDGGTYMCQAESLSSPLASETIKISVRYGPGEKCVDRPSYRHCHQIIKHKFCGNKYYGQYCCRSCMEAGFLPAGLS